jgi:hypothetical protein
VLIQHVCMRSIEGVQGSVHKSQIVILQLTASGTLFLACLTQSLQPLLQEHTKIKSAQTKVTELENCTEHLRNLTIPSNIEGAKCKLTLHEATSRLHRDHLKLRFRSHVTTSKFLQHNKHLTRKQTVHT